ncbi:MFS sugar transporter-like protein [Dactylonectria macrodidyma]|uniref:MFS sugar transporter-like protein n=1 Tax=Dactylonectria macrodidyma TaxID=307937 RepID=A0A9P9DLU3_9HYPO|nr:MFS sugar transporter-like protein [Dactylonectria macrodidyma]
MAATNIVGNGGASVSHVGNVDETIPTISVKRRGIRGVLDDIKEYRTTYLVTFIASFGGMLYGWDTGLIGGVLTMPAFQESFKIDPTSDHFANLQGNIVSVLQGGCFFGAASSFYVSDTFGRKYSLIFADIIFLIGSVIQTCCALGNTSLVPLYIGRFVGGFGVGLISATVPTYIGENANKEIRGRCIGCMQLFNVTGICLSYFVNYGIAVNKVLAPYSALRWRIPFALQMLPGFFLLVGIIFQNETPRWLVEKDRIGEARKALARVRSKPTDDPVVIKELDEIVNDFSGHEGLSLWQQMKASVANKQMLYPVSLAVILNFFQQWTGSNGINYYSPQIFKSIGLQGNSAGLFATGIYGVVKIIITALGLCFATEQLGRKYCLIIGSVGQAFAMYYIGIYTGVAPPVPGAAITGGGIFSIICVYLFVVFFSFGWGPIPYVLSAECCPNHLRSFTMALALMMQWLCNFTIAKITPLMLSGIGYGTFLVFGSSGIIMLLFTIFFVPETKNIPLESIHLLFEGDIIKGCVKDMVPSKTRAREMKLVSEREDASGKGVNEV